MDNRPLCEFQEEKYGRYIKGLHMNHSRWCQIGYEKDRGQKGTLSRWDDGHYLLRKGMEKNVT